MWCWNCWIGKTNLITLSKDWYIEPVKDLSFFTETSDHESNEDEQSSEDVNSNGKRWLWLKMKLLRDVEDYVLCKKARKKKNN